MTGKNNGIHRRYSLS